MSKDTKKKVYRSFRAASASLPQKLKACLWLRISQAPSLNTRNRKKHAEPTICQLVGSILSTGKSFSKANLQRSTLRIFLNQANRQS